MDIPFPNKKYDVILADPPWNVKAGCEWNSNGKSRDLEYPTMNIEEIKEIPVQDIAADDCKLFLWTINKYLKESFEVMESWGFKFSTMIVWCKSPNGIGLGGTFSPTNEYLLFGYKGKVKALKRHDSTWFFANRLRHSRKPHKFRQLIDETFKGNKIELFAREKAHGWDVWGNEAPDCIDDNVATSLHKSPKIKQLCFQGWNV